MSSTGVDSVVSLCAHFIGKPSLQKAFSGASTRTMEVAPVHQKGNPERKTRSNVDEYFVLAIHTLATCIGLNPYKIDKETGEVSFRWISRETLWSLIRLVVFNSPFSFLPVIFAALYAPAEWKPEERSGFATSNSTATSTVYFAVCAVEYISCYSYFVLSGAAKKEISDLKGSSGI